MEDSLRGHVCQNAYWCLVVSSNGQICFQWCVMHGCASSASHLLFFVRGCQCHTTLMQQKDGCWIGMYSAQNRMDSFTFREALTVTQCALVLHSIWRILGGARTARGFLCALHSGRAVIGCFRCIIILSHLDFTFAFYYKKLHQATSLAYMHINFFYFRIKKLTYIYFNA